MIESTPPDSPRESTIAEGLSILREAKLMCEAVWVDFDERLINAGLVILPIQTAFMALLALTPRTKLLSAVLNSRYVLDCHVWNDLTQISSTGPVGYSDTT